MRILLDTHVLLWASQGSQKLGSRARRIMMGADELFVSSASLWEMSIKTSLGRLQIDWDLLLTGLRAMHVRELRISWEHALALKTLPLVSKDPFDRMLRASHYRTFGVVDARPCAFGIWRVRYAGLRQNSPARASLLLYLLIQTD